MAHRRSGFAKKIDTVHWTLGTFSVQGLTAGSSAVNVFSAQHLPETLMRIRGEVVVAPATQLADGVGVSVSMGMIQVPEGTGTTVLWSPITDGDAPWIWWDTVHILYTETVTDVIATQETLSGRRVIDSKAMRKMRNTEIQFVVEQATVFSATSIDLMGTIRALFGS